MRDEIQIQVERLLQNYEAEPEHARQVARLSDLLFTELKTWHRLREEQREWLQVASLLHDIGWSQTSSGSGHHKHSARLIRSHDWTGIEKRAVHVIALIARYHRKSLPKAEHEDYFHLSMEDQHLVSVLAGILRVADALDRSHQSVVTGLKKSAEADRILIEVSVRGGFDPEMGAVTRKKDLLEQVSGQPVIIRVK